MDDEVFWCDRWLSQVQVVELDGVTEADSLGGGIYEFVSSVVVEVQADAEPVMCAEVPLFACSRFGVDGDFASDGSEQCGIVVDGTVVVFPH